MKMQELRQLTPKKLKEMLEKIRRELAVSRFHVKTGQNKNTAEILKQRKTVARILTLLLEQKANASKI